MIMNFSFRIKYYIFLKQNSKLYAMILDFLRSYQNYKKKKDIRWMNAWFKTCIYFGRWGCDSTGANGYMCVQTTSTRKCQVNLNAKAAYDRGIKCKHALEWSKLYNLKKNMYNN